MDVLDSQFPIIVFFITYFLWWLINIILEQHLGMGPVIVSSKEVINQDGQQDSERGQTNKILMRNSRSVDQEGKYRIKTKSSLIFTKFVASLILFFWAILPFFDAQPWDEYIQLFYYNDASILQMKFIQGAAATTLSWYLFETSIINQYYKIQWSVILHHWLTAMAALLILMNVFFSAAILYGIILVAFAWPVTFILAFRIEYGAKYPQLARKASQFSYFYYSLLIYSCIALQIVVLWNGIQTGAYTTSYICLIIFCCLAWGFDDCKAAGVMKESVKLYYEDLDFNRVK